MQDEYDEDLFIAIANSLKDVDDSNLNYALRESKKFDTFCAELQGSAKRSRQTNQAVENYRYNETSRETLCNKNIYAHLLKYVSMSSLAALYRTSRRSKELIEDATTRHPIKSLYVDSVKGFKIAARPDKYQGTLFKKIARSLNTLRFRIREAGAVNFACILENVVGSSITHIYINVAHISDVEWFTMSYCYEEGYRGYFRVYHEMDYKVPCSSYIVYSYGDWETYREPVRDHNGSLFNALTDY